MIMRLIADAEILVGVIITLAFLLFHRPSKIFRWSTVDASGWLFVVFLSYLHAGVATVLYRTTLTPVPDQYGFEVVTSVAISTAIIALVILRLVMFILFKRGRRL